MRVSGPKGALRAEGMRLIDDKILSMLPVIALALAACDGSVPTREEIVAKYPAVEQGSAQPENTRILCPFLRMLRRAGLVEEGPAFRARAAVPVPTVAEAAGEFGCATLDCGAVALLIASRQSGSGLDVERLHDAAPISHECGLTWGPGETEVNPGVRQSTLDRLAELADDDGNLRYEDLQRVKLEICAAQNVKMTRGGEIEIKAMFAYLGGVDNGTVRLGDVERFLNATMPEIKTTSWINAALLSRVR